MPRPSLRRKICDVVPPSPDVMHAAQLAMAELNLQGEQCVVVSRKLAHLLPEAGTPEVMRLTEFGRAMVGKKRVAPDNVQTLLCRCRS